MLPSSANECHARPAGRPGPLAEPAEVLGRRPAPVRGQAGTAGPYNRFLERKRNLIFGLCDTTGPRIGQHPGLDKSDNNRYCCIEYPAKTPFPPPIVGT